MFRTYRQTDKQTEEGTSGQSIAQHVSSCECPHHQYSDLHHNLDFRLVLRSNVVFGLGHTKLVSLVLLLAWKVESFGSGIELEGQVFGGVLVLLELF